MRPTPYAKKGVFSEVNDTVSRAISTAGADPLLLYGHNDSNLAAIERKYRVTLVARGEKVTVQGEPKRVREASNLLTQLVGLCGKGAGSDEEDVRMALQSFQEGDQEPADGPFPKILLSAKKQAVRPRSAGQDLYVSSIAKYDIVFGIGPAGTGKTYLAVAVAAAALKEKRVSRIILARPAVEAGERLGFLPGDFQEKVDPYLRPLYDALYDIIAPDRIRQLLDMRVIEIVPMAYMRGRTLNHAFVILDEAQNTTPTQMKMFLTRLGAYSKAVITGDITQVDLPDAASSGLIQIQGILKGIEGIKFVYLTERDVVRHVLVQEIIKAYDTYESLMERREAKEQRSEGARGDVV